MIQTLAQSNMRESRQKMRTKARQQVRNSAAKSKRAALRRRKKTYGF